MFPKTKYGALKARIKALLAINSDDAAILEHQLIMEHMRSICKELTDENNHKSTTLLAACNTISIAETSLPQGDVGKVHSQSHDYAAAAATFL